jgi:hypothetical protein
MGKHLTIFSHLGPNAIRPVIISYVLIESVFAMLFFICPFGLKGLMGKGGKGNV